MGKIIFIVRFPGSKLLNYTVQQQTPYAYQLCTSWMENFVATSNGGVFFNKVRIAAAKLTAHPRQIGKLHSELNSTLKFGKSQRANLSLKVYLRDGTLSSHIERIPQREPAPPPRRWWGRMFNPSFANWFNYFAMHLSIANYPSIHLASSMSRDWACEDLALSICSSCFGTGPIL